MDFPTIYGRAGRVEGRRGSVTWFPMLTATIIMFALIADLAGYITKGRVFRSCIAQPAVPSSMLPPASVLWRMAEVSQVLEEMQHQGPRPVLLTC